MKNDFEITEYLKGITDKELSRELYRRKSLNKVKAVPHTCFHCKYKICYTQAKKMEKKGLLEYAVDNFGQSAMCLIRTNKFSPTYYDRTNNWQTCDKFEPKKKNE